MASWREKQGFDGTRVRICICDATEIGLCTSDGSCICVMMGGWAGLYIYIYIYIYIYHIYINKYICVYMIWNDDAHTHIQTQTHIHTHTYKPTMTHTRAPAYILPWRKWAVPLVNTTNTEKKIPKKRSETCASAKLRRSFFLLVEPHEPHQKSEVQRIRNSRIPNSEFRIRNCNSSRVGQFRNYYSGFIPEPEKKNFG